MQGEAPIPPVPFVVGVGRSGTSLIRMMLDSHSDLAMLPEVGMLDGLLRMARRRRLSPTAVAKLVRRHHDRWSFRIDGDLLIERLRRLEVLDVSGAMRSVGLSYAECFQKPRWGEKIPIYATRIAEIAALLPEARFIHVIRDCRAVVSSMRRMPFRPHSSIDRLAAHWVAVVTEARRQGCRTPHYLEVRYESLIREPEREARRLCEHLSLPFEPAMLDYSDRAEAHLSGLMTTWRRGSLFPYTASKRRHNHRFLAEPPRSDRIDAWKTDLNARDLRQIDAAAGNLMNSLGYMT